MPVYRKYSLVIVLIIIFTGMLSFEKTLTPLFSIGALTSAYIGFMAWCFTIDSWHMLKKRHSQLEQGVLDLLTIVDKQGDKDTAEKLAAILRGENIIERPTES